MTLGLTALLTATAGAIGVGAADPSQLASRAGTAANPRSFLLRVYRVRTDWETPRGGRGDVEILDWITLRDPDDRVPFPIVTEGTRERLLTGGDFDIESLRVAKDGTLWFGEEFGPFLLHTDPTGRVIDAPIPARGVRQPRRLPEPLRSARRQRGAGRRHPPRPPCRRSAGHPPGGAERRRHP